MWRHPHTPILRIVWIPIFFLLALVGIARLGVPTPTPSPSPPSSPPPSSWSPVIEDAPRNWVLRRSIHEAQRPRQKRTNHEKGREFFQENWEPSVSCAYERRVGKPGDGGKWVCDPDTLLSRPRVVVFSLGSNNDFSFEEEMRGILGPRAEIHTFDIQPGSNVPSFVTYHKGRVTSVCETMAGHDRVDVLKMDIEGSEFDVLLGASKEGCLSKVDQLLIEVHLLRGWAGTSAAKAHDMFAALTERDGFAIFHKEPNIQYADGDACEFSLVKVYF